MIWIEEIVIVVEANEYNHVYFTNSGGVEYVEFIYNDVHFPIHISKVMWKYLKQSSGAENWLTFWLKACKHPRIKMELNII